MVDRENSKVFLSTGICQKNRRFLFWLLKKKKKNGRKYRGKWVGWGYNTHNFLLRVRNEKEREREREKSFFSCFRKINKQVHWDLTTWLLFVLFLSLFFPHFYDFGQLFLSPFILFWNGMTTTTTTTYNAGAFPRQPNDERRQKREKVVPPYLWRSPTAREAGDLRLGNYKTSSSSSERGSIPLSTYFFYLLSLLTIPFVHFIANEWHNQKIKQPTQLDDK
jgi:hypothetical protein